jgi:hypothetical protein
MGGLTLCESDRMAAVSRVSEPAMTGTLATFSIGSRGRRDRLQFAALLGEYSSIERKSLQPASMRGPQ